MKRKIAKIEKLRDDARRVVASCSGEVTCDPIEVDNRLTEDVLNKVLKILGEEENESYISSTFCLDDGADVRLRYNR